MGLGPGTSEEIIAIDQTGEFRRPRDKLLHCGTTSISSLVDLEQHELLRWHTRIYDGPLFFPPSAVLTCCSTSFTTPRSHLCPSFPEDSVWAARWWAPERRGGVLPLPQASWSRLETQWKPSVRSHVHRRISTLLDFIYGCMYVKLDVSKTRLKQSVGENMLKKSNF